MQGFVKTIVLDKGFGFITPDSGADVFFHVHDLQPDLAFDDTLRQRRVEFDIAADPRSGKSRAAFVRPAQ